MNYGVHIASIKKNKKNKKNKKIKKKIYIYIPLLLLCILFSLLHEVKNKSFNFLDSWLASWISDRQSTGDLV